MAARDFNARCRDFDIGVERIGGENAYDQEDYRSYIIERMDDEFSLTVEVRKTDMGIKLDSYSGCSKLFSEYGNSIGRVLRTSPMDWH